jgi:hypothetical protein
MKYNNKYAIALVLLASSAFGASSAPSVPDYSALTTAVNNALGADKTFKGIDDAAKTSLNFSPEQLAAFEVKKDEVLDGTKIKEILEEVYKTQVAEAEKQKAEAAEAERQAAEAAEAERQKAEALKNATPDQIPSVDNAPNPSGDDKTPNPSGENNPNPSDKDETPKQDTTDEKNAAKVAEDEKNAAKVAEDEKNAAKVAEDEKNAAKVAEDNKKLAEQKQKDDDEKANKTTDDPIAKIKAALDSVDDFSKLSADAIKALGLTEKQVEALKKANVTKATTDEDINKALKGEAEATTSSGSSSVTDSGTEKGKNAEIPFYKNAWIMVPSGVILLSAIGGGVFMMTRKTEDTDL